MFGRRLAIFGFVQRQCGLLIKGPQAAAVFDPSGDIIELVATAATVMGDYCPQVLPFMCKAHLPLASAS